MNKIIGIIIGVLIVGFFINSYINKRAEQKTKKEKQERVEKKKEALIAELVLKNNAIDDWEAKLSGEEKFRIPSLLTIELENVWLKPNPILFEGAIKDISTADQSNYRVIIERDFLYDSDYQFYTDMRLSLLADKELIDKFLKRHPNIFKNFGRNNKIAVIADIKSIETKDYFNEFSEYDEIKVGIGKLIDIEFIGEMSY